MAISRHLIALAIAFAIGGPAPAGADDEFRRAVSFEPTLLALCPSDRPQNVGRGCKDGALDRLAKQAETAFKAALAKVRPATAPLLKRDQVWFREMMESAVERGVLVSDAADDPEDQDRAAAALRKRIAALREMAAGFGRSGVSGRWANAFGSIAIAGEMDGALRVTASTIATYGSDTEDRPSCEAAAVVEILEMMTTLGVFVVAMPHIPDVVGGAFRVADFEVTKVRNGIELNS
jgi:hypothetical protein